MKAKPAPRGFALLAEDEEEEKKEEAAVAVPAPAPKPAPVVKMPKTMTEEELEAQEREYRFTLRVANLPMDITVKKLQAIFGDFTGFDKITLPLKMGRPRGFAFIEFTNPEDAGDCLYSLRDELEIKGRRVDGQTDKVVLEYARSNVGASRT